MLGLARLVERCLGLIRQGGSGSSGIRRIASVLGAVLVVLVAVLISYLRIVHNLNLGP